MSLEIETSGLHHIVLRGSPNATVKVELKRSIFEASVCDPVICNPVRVNACRMDVFKRPSVFDMRVSEGSENDYDSLNVRVACEHKGWAIALFAGIIPSISVIVICLITWRRSHRDFSEARTSTASPVYAYPGTHADSHFGGVKQVVDFV